MSTPKPWSYSALSDFRNCPKQFFHKRVARDLPPEVKSDNQEWGIYVHEKFQKRQAHIDYALPLDLKAHEEYHQGLTKYARGENRRLWVESKITFDKRVQVLQDGWFHPDVWYRGVIDWRALDREGEGHNARLVDYKTGKKKPDYTELGIFAIHTFMEFPWIELIDARYYWCGDFSETRKVWSRADIPALWAMVVPDLKQYAQAFKTDTWQPRTSGLCHGWCPVTSCMHWKPKK